MAPLFEPVRQFLSNLQLSHALTVCACCGSCTRSIWGTGQDQCATIKRQLSMLLPGVSIFLDVDEGGSNKYQLL